MTFLSLLTAAAVLFVWVSYTERVSENALSVKEALRVGDPDIVAMRQSQLREMEAHRNKRIAVVIAAGLVLLGITAWSDSHDSSRASAEYESAWQDGWRGGCDAVFGYLGVETLYYGDSSIAFRECLALNDTVMPGMPQVRLEDAATRGYEDGAGAALDTAFGRAPVLCFGEDCFSRTDLTARIAAGAGR